jgi:glycosyltransferase involved in cell wall biosynthesis/protein-tyrosine-phosphatase
MTTATVSPADTTQTLRVCHIASGDLWAGAEVQLATSASYLASAPRVKVSAVLLNEGRLADELRRMGVHVTVVDERRHGPLSILAFTSRVLRQQQIDIVHTHRYKESVLGTLAAKRARVPRVIRTVHGINEGLTGWAGARMRLYETVDRIVLWWFADSVIAVSKRIEETLRTSGYRPGSLRHLHNGVHLGKVKASRTREEVTRELGIDPGALIVGTVGRLSPIKGHSWFLQAAQRIVEQTPGAIFLIVGGGPLEADLAATAAQLGIGTNCRFVGSRDDVYDLIAAMDIFVLPSLDEGVPMAILEAMALEKPIVASAVGGLPEIIEHGATGLLVRPRDDRAMAETCLSLARNREWARALGAAARSAVEKDFSHESNGRALIDVYHGNNRRLERPHHRPRASAGRPGTLAMFFGLARILPAYVNRKLALAANRRRMHRLRRNPAPLMSILRRATTVLVLCHGNIIRSPFAARLLANAVGDHRVSIRSAGLGAVAGSPAHPRALVAATARNIDLSQHTAAPVTPDAVAASDVIFVMDVPQWAALCQRFPEARAKTFLLASLAPSTPLEVRDPVNGDEPLFTACYEHVARAVDPISRALGAEPAMAWRGSEPCLCR